MHRRQLSAKLGLSLLLMVCAGGLEAALVCAGPRTTVVSGVALGGLAVTAGAAWYAYSVLRGHLRGVAEEIGARAEDLATAVADLTRTEDGVRDGARSRTAAIEQASDSLDRAKTKALANAEQSGRANALAGETHAAADRGVREVAAIGDAVEALNQSSGEIAKILRTIDSIAFQTNILALNAAVEAARAGESGAGFAVVAQEVRRLATNTADAARETSGKIDDAINWISQCELLKTEVVGTLNDIAGKSRELDALVAAVSASTREESATIAEVEAAVAGIRQSLQEGLLGADHATETARQLQSQAEQFRVCAGRLDSVPAATVASGLAEDSGTAVRR